MGIASRIRNLTTEILSDAHYTLRRHRYDWHRSDGDWQEETRESFDRGSGCAVLLHDPERDTVLLVRQFRFPAYENGHDALMLEVPAGLLEGADPAKRMRAEIEEETGYRVGPLMPLWDAFTSPGAVTERIHAFAAHYSPADRVSDGGGAAGETEDIEVVEMPLSEALAGISDGTIRDLKTIALLQHAALNR